MRDIKPNPLAMALREFFSDFIPRARGLSSCTLLSYRDSLALLLKFMADHIGRPVAELGLEAITPEVVMAFLDHLEAGRHNKASTRNVRLAAIHAFARHVATSRPECLEGCQRILAVPFKRAGARVVDYLEFEEIQAILAGIDRSSPDGRRDFVLLATMFNTGARVQETLDLRPCDLQLERPFQLRLFGKGRKERICPLWPQTAQLLKAFLDEAGIEAGTGERLFRNHRGTPLTRFGIRYLLAKYCDQAKPSVPSLSGKRLHPHSMRHSTAVHLLQAGVDLPTISHWLGHASINTTNRYAKVDLEMKRRAIAKAEPLTPGGPEATWRTNGSILEWLESL
jgi:site-specific recombinase XerD